MPIGIKSGMKKEEATVRPLERVPTLDDVAVIAGVSPATVSRFFTNPKIVAKATGERISQAVEKTGYIPNALAGGLASSKSRMVAVLIPHLSDSLFNDTIEKMTKELTDSGSIVLLGLTGLSIEGTNGLIRTALSRRVDAIISTGPITKEVGLQIRRSQTSLIQIWELPDEPIESAIGFSHQDAGRDIARFVAVRGYRRPFVVTAAGRRARIRSESFKAEWVAQGGQNPEEVEVDLPARFGHARDVFAKIQAMKERPDIILCGSDYLAQGIIVEAHHSGLRVPDDIAVMGFGNSVVASEMRPTITTVEVDGSRIAREVIAVLRQRDKSSQSSGEVIDVGFRIVERESA